MKACLQDNINIQPVNIYYHSVNDERVGRYLRPFIGWYGDMTLGGHIITFLSFRKTTVKVVFNSILVSNDYQDRKDLSSATHAIMDNRLQQLHRDDIHIKQATSR